MASRQSLEGILLPIGVTRKTRIVDEMAIFATTMRSGAEYLTVESKMLQI
jgi:hypothetical protein